MTGLIRFNGVPAVRWSPFAVHGLHGANRVNDAGTPEFDRVVDSLASRAFFDTRSTGELRADVRETAGAYIVQLDVPGVAREDITVDVDEKTVRIEAAFKRETAEGEKAVLSERAAGSLSRAFRLPLAVDAEQASARHEQGVLTLTLPKKNVATQKRLEIN